MMNNHESTAFTANDWFFDMWDSPIDAVPAPSKEPVRTAWHIEQTELQDGLRTGKPDLIWTTERLRYELGETHDHSA